MSDRMVERVSQSAPAGGISSGRVRVLRSSIDRKTTRQNLLQPVLLFVGNGSDTCGRSVRMVRREIHRHQRTRAAVLQSELRYGSPVHAAGTARKPADSYGGAGGMAGETDGGSSGKQGGETREAGPGGVWEDQYVHRAGWAARTHSIPPEA